MGLSFKLRVHLLFAKKRWNKFKSKWKGISFTRMTPTRAKTTAMVGAASTGVVVNVVGNAGIKAGIAIAKTHILAAALVFGVAAAILWYNTDVSAEEFGEEDIQMVHGIVAGMNRTPTGDNARLMDIGYQAVVGTTFQERLEIDAEISEAEDEEEKAKIRSTNAFLMEEDEKYDEPEPKPFSGSIFKRKFNDTDDIDEEESNAFTGNYDTLEDELPEEPDRPEIGRGKRVGLLGNETTPDWLSI